MEILSMIKNLILIGIYLLFIGSCGEQVYNDLKTQAVKAHKRGVVNMSEWSRELWR